MSLPMSRRLGLAWIGLLALPALPAAAAGFATGADSVFIGFDSSVVANGQLIALPQLDVGFNGSAAKPFVMDTGSTGIVVSPDNYTLQPGAQPIGPGQITYNSSGRTLSGYYYSTTVAITDGTHSASASVPVLLVDTITTCPAGGSCTVNNNPTGVAMFGVGFGQEPAGQPYGTPDKNPFLHITQIDGQSASASQGYIVTSTGVFLGLTAANTAQFAPANQVSLGWNATYSDWNRTPVTLTAGGATGPGTLLPDTGISYMFVQPALGAVVQTIPTTDATGPCASVSCAAPGETFVIAIGSDPNNPAFTYSVTIAPGSTGAPIAQPIAPEYVVPLTPAAPSPAFSTVNTGFHFYNAVNYAYDYQNGVVGFVSNSVPEPMSATLLGAGLLGLFGLGRRRGGR